jgi:hypothetical protein
LKGDNGCVPAATNRAGVRVIASVLAFPVLIVAIGVVMSALGDDEIEGLEFVAILVPVALLAAVIGRW